MNEQLGETRSRGPGFLRDGDKTRRKTPPLFSGPAAGFRSDFGTAAIKTGDTAREGTSFVPFKASETLTDAPIQASKRRPEDDVELDVPGDKYDLSAYGGDTSMYFANAMPTGVLSQTPPPDDKIDKIFHIGAAPNVGGQNVDLKQTWGPDGTPLHGPTLQRLPHIFSKNGLGSEMRPKEISNMAFELTAGMRVADQNGRRKNGVTDAEMNKAGRDYDAGVYRMKEMYYTQLKRMRDRYGLYGTQMHPDDFLKKAGPQYFDDMRSMQDIIDLSMHGGKYLDPANEKDQEFITLANYFFAVDQQVRTYIAAAQQYYGPMQADDDSLQTALGFAGNIDYGLEKKITGARGFSPKQQARYNSSLKSRLGKKGMTERLFGRFH